MLNKVRRVQRLGGPDTTSPTLEHDSEVKIEQTNGDHNVNELRANRTPQALKKRKVHIQRPTKTKVKASRYP